MNVPSSSSVRMSGPRPESGLDELVVRWDCHSVWSGCSLSCLTSNAPNQPRQAVMMARTTGASAPFGCWAAHVLGGLSVWFGLAQGRLPDNLRVQRLALFDNIRGKHTCHSAAGVGVVVHNSRRDDERLSGFQSRG